MPVRYTLSGNLFRMDLEGNYTPEEIIQTYETALSDPDFPAHPHFLFDVTRSAELAGRDSQSIGHIAQYFGERSDRVGNRCAIVAAQPVHYGLCRMAATIAATRGADVQVFSTVEAAMSWLDTEEETRAKEEESEAI
jgi:hypothetical protein